MKRVILVFLPLFFIVFSLLFSLFYPPIHDHYFDSRPHLIEDSRTVFSYILGGEELPKQLTEKEIFHLGDVKRIITAIKFILLISSLMVIFGLFRYDIPSQLRIGGMLTIISGFLLALLASSFEWAFNKMHMILFTPESWMFNRTDLLIILYPGEFFFDFFVSILLNVLILGFISVFIGVLLRRNHYDLLQ